MMPTASTDTETAQAENGLHWQTLHGERCVAGRSMTPPCTAVSVQVYAEVVRGLGESIVSGLVPGSALGCVIKKSDLENPEV